MYQHDHKDCCLNVKIRSVWTCLYHSAHLILLSMSVKFDNQFTKCTMILDILKSCMLFPVLVVQNELGPAIIVVMSGL